MTAKYAIQELDNGWVLSSEEGEFYYDTFFKLISAMVKIEEEHIKLTLEA